MISVPVVGDEGDPLRSRLREKLATGCIITAAQNPGHSSPADRIIGAPEPKLAWVGSTGRRNVVGSELFQEVHDGAHGSSRLVGRAEAGAMDPVEGWTIAQ